MKGLRTAGVLTLALLASLALTGGPAAAQQKRPNIVMLMQDDTGWFDFGSYGGGAALGHPTPNVDRLAREARDSRTGTARPVARRAVRRS